MSRRAASPASSRASTFTAATWPSFDGGLIQPGHPSAAARPVSHRLDVVVHDLADAGQAHVADVESRVQPRVQAGQRAE